MNRDLNRAAHLKVIYEVPCASCDGITRHEVLTCVDDSESTVDALYQAQYEILSCCGCGQISFRQDWQSTDDTEYDGKGSEIFELHPELFPPRRAGAKKIEQEHFLPQIIRSIYRELHQAISNNQRVLAGIGIRALVEAVCLEKRAKGKNLQERIDDLSSQKVLTEQAAQILHGIRFLGNKAAHKLASPDDEQLDAAMAIAEVLLMNVYILPRNGKKLGQK